MKKLAIDGPQFQDEYYREPLPRLPPFASGEVPNAGQIVDNIYQQLVAKGVPPGIALQQAQQFRQMMYNSQLTPDSNNLKLMHDAAAGFTALDPTQILASKQLFANPLAAQQHSQFLEGSPTAQRLLAMGNRSWRNSDPDTQYQQAVAVMSEQVRAKMRAEGNPIGIADARRIAERYLGGPEAFKRELSNANSFASPTHFGDLSESLGYNVGLGAGIHTLQDAFMGGQGQPTGWRATAADMKKSLMPFSGVGGEVQMARNNLQAAMRSGNPALIAQARQEYTAVAKRMAQGLSGTLGNLVPAGMNALPLAFGADQALRRNLRGESSGDFVKRMFSVGLPGDQFNMDVDDWITAGSIAPHAAAQGYLFNTLPRQLGEGFKTDPLRAIKRTLSKGSLVSEAPDVLTDLAHLGFGSPAAQRQLATEIMSRQRVLDKRHKLLGISANMDPFNDGGALEGIGQRGIFNLIRSNFRNAGAGDVLGGVLQSGTDLALAPLRLGAQGVGALGDVASFVGNRLGYKIDPTLGSKLRQHLDPTTATRAWGDNLAHLVSRARGTPLEQAENFIVPNRSRTEPAAAREEIKAIDAADAAPRRTYGLSKVLK